MFRAKLSVVPAAGSRWSRGCRPAARSTDEDKTANWSPNRIYAEAKDELDSGAYDKAVPLFEKLEGRAAGTPLAQQAQLEKAYAHYKAGDQAQAIATLDRFMKLHPASPAIDYALYLKGIVNFNDNLGMFSWLTRQDLSERDQKAAKESFESFKELVDALSRFALHARRPRAHELHRQLAGAVRGARGALLLLARRLRGRHQPRADRAGRLPRRAGARRSAATSWCARTTRWA